jgi:arachidonate 15-lipoxygenase
MGKTFSRSGRPPVPEGTPLELREIDWDPRRPCDPTESDLGISVEVTPLAKEPKNRLVVLGDSISHGFKSFAIADTDVSWPALVAAYAGIKDFRFPRYPGPENCPGLPLNLEALVRQLQDSAPGSVLDVAGDALLLGRLRSLMDEVEDYWERGEGRQILQDSAAGPINHNLAIWGWDIRDALGRNVGRLRQQLQEAPGKHDALIRQIPSAAGERSALITLAGGGDDDTPVSLARRLGNEGGGDDPGIETLVVALGANNVLGTVLNFEVNWTSDESEDFKDPDAKKCFNAWLPSHFAAEFDELVLAVEGIKAQHVIFLTVPHVTIVPMVRGIRNKMPGDRYFARYTRAWIGDDAFSANRHPCLTGDQLRVLDFAVDQYNDHIVERVRDARRRRRDWRVLDIAGILDRLAYRRYLIDEEARPRWWKPYELPAAYRELSPQPDTRFYRSDQFGRFEGGLFALDGVHPTTIGYGIIAGEVMRVMAECGVRMEQAAPDYQTLVRETDQLICDPPTRISSILEFIESVNKVVDLFQAIRGRSGSRGSSQRSGGGYVADDSGRQFAERSDDGHFWRIELSNPMSTVIPQLAGPLRGVCNAFGALVERPAQLLIPWGFRRCFWNGFSIVKFRGNKPATVPPPVEGRPLIPVPFRSEFPGIPIDGIVVADHVPRDEAKPMQRLKHLVTQVQVTLSRVLPPMRRGLPAIPADPYEALAGAYTQAHRRSYKTPRRPPEYSDGVDLGQLAVASPYACYLQKSGDERFRWDFSILDEFECHRGLRPPRAVVEFRLDPRKKKLEAVGIDSDLGWSKPEEARWDEASRLALCAVTTHLSLVRHFNWIHLVAGARLAMITRNHLPADHSVRRLLWPHVYATQYSNRVVTPPQMIRGGDFESVFSYTHRGMCDLFEATVDEFDLRTIDPHVDASRRGVFGAGFETPALDNRLALMKVLREHASRYLMLYFPNDAALAGDEPFRRWLEELERNIPRGVRELMGGGVTLAGAARLLSTLIYLVTVEHEIVGSGLWNYQLWSDVNPVRVYENRSRPPLDVYQRLVNADFVLNVERTPLMSDFSRLALDPQGEEAFARFLADLRALQADLDRQPAACWRIEPRDLKANINA